MFYAIFQVVLVGGNTTRKESISQENGGTPGELPNAIEEPSPVLGEHEEGAGPEEEDEDMFQMDEVKWASIFFYSRR